MQVLPVIDLMQGVVVRGIGGRRSEYRPVRSQLCSGATPAEVAAALVKFGFRRVYVADLNAIAGAAPAWNDFAAIAAAGLDLVIDAGANRLDLARQIAAVPGPGGNGATVVIGMESLPAPDLLTEIVQCLGERRTIFSLDLKAGKPLVRCAEWQALLAEEIARDAIGRGLRRLILLDLARVGESSGPGTEDLATTLRAQFPEVEFIGGGGVRSLSDLLAMQRAGYAAALVASALHDGQLAPHELQSHGMLA